MKTNVYLAPAVVEAPGSGSATDSKVIKSPLGELDPNSGNDMKRCYIEVVNGLYLGPITPAEFETAQRKLATGNGSDWQLLVTRQKEAADLVSTYGPIVSQFSDRARFHLPGVNDDAGKPLVITQATLFSHVFRTSSKLRTSILKSMRTVTKS